MLGMRPSDRMTGAPSTVVATVGRQFDVVVCHQRRLAASVRTATECDFILAFYSDLRSR